MYIINQNLTFAECVASDTDSEEGCTDELITDGNVSNSCVLGEEGTTTERIYNYNLYLTQKNEFIINI